MDRPCFGSLRHYWDGSVNHHLVTKIGENAESLLAVGAAEFGRVDLLMQGNAQGRVQLFDFLRVRRQDVCFLSNFYLAEYSAPDSSVYESKKINNTVIPYSN